MDRPTLSRRIGMLLLFVNIFTCHPSMVMFKCAVCQGMLIQNAVATCMLIKTGNIHVFYA
jgi:hypothetical protein